MEILLLLIPLSVVLVMLIGAAFWWSVKSGQFDDLEGPAHRILADDDRASTHGQSSAKPLHESRDLTSVNAGRDLAK